VTRARWEPIAVAAAAVGLGVAVADAARRAPGFSLAGDSPARVALGIAAGWTVVAAGLALHGGGSRAVGRLLAAGGCAWLAAGLATPGARLAPVFTLGIVAVMLAPAPIGWAMLLEAGDRLHRADHAVVAALWLALGGLLGLLSALAYDPTAAGCAECATNLLVLADAPATVEGAARAGVRLGLVALAACIALALWRLARASPARRRRALPILLPGCAYLALAAAQLAHDWGRGNVGNDPTEQALWTAQAVALIGIAAGVALVRAQARRRRSRLARLVVELGATPRPGGLRDALAELLGDPGLELLHRGSDGWIDARGHARAPQQGAGTTPLVRDGEPVALLCHRPGLLDDARVAAEIDRSVRLGLDHERLQARLQQQLEHLRRSRADVTAASEAERRLLERDLHDGAQQQLAAFTFAVGLARNRVPPPLDGRLEPAQREVQHALNELRELAHGLYPVALAEAGLAAAIESLSDRRPGLRPVRLPTGRYSRAVEETAYFVIAGLADHWSPQPVTVNAVRDGERLVLDMQAATSAPADLVAIEDRLSALDGTLSVQQSQGGPTRVTAEFPCA
jgi:signal transduction histidine kinase